MPFEYAIVIHNVCGITLSAVFLLYTILNIKTKNYKQYVPHLKGMMPMLIAQAKYYIYGVFKGHPHPFETNPDAKPIIDAACGAGKSLIISAVADRIIQQNPGGGAVLVVTHRAELVKQNHAKLPAHLRGTIFSASVGKKDLTGQVIFANIQSIQKQWHKMPKFQAVLIDEAHFAAKAYAEFVEKITAKQSPGARIIGLTATPYNGAGVWLHMLPAHRIFTGLACEVGIGDDAGSDQVLDAIRRDSNLVPDTHPAARWLLGRDDWVRAVPHREAV